MKNKIVIQIWFIALYDNYVKLGKPKQKGKNKEKKIELKWNITISPANWQGCVNGNNKVLP